MVTQYIQPNITANTTQAISVGPTPPAPGYNALWLSTALADARFPSHPGQTLFTFDDGTANQEPNVWVYNGQVFMLTSGQKLWVANDPRGPWTAKGTVLANAYHAGMWIETVVGVPTIYLFYWPGSGATTLKCSYNTLAQLAGGSPSSGWTNVGTILPNANSIPGGLTSTYTFGNTAMVKVGSQYRLFVEWLDPQEAHWQTMLFQSASPTGPFTALSSNLYSGNGQLALR